MISRHVYPKTLNETVELLDDDTKLLAGGTALALSQNTELETLVDLRDLGLSYIKQEGNEIWIGATTSAYQILRSELLPNSLRMAADKIGVLPLLNSVTIGGNLAILYPWVDLPPMLFALNASIVLYNGESLVYTSDEFLNYAIERNIGNRNELIQEIRVPIPPSNSYSEYQSQTLLENEKAQLNLASYFEWDNQKNITECRVFVNATTKNPVKISLDHLLGEKLTDENIFACEDIIRSIPMVPNYKTSREYRTHILKIYLQRTLANCSKVMEEI